MNFSRQISFGDQILEALFTKIYGPADKFFVVLSDDQKELASFDMVRHFDHWTIVHPAPEWTAPLENQLSLLINKTVLG